MELTEQQKEALDMNEKQHCNVMFCVGTKQEVDITFRAIIDYMQGREFRYNKEKKLIQEIKPDNSCRYIKVANTNDYNDVVGTQTVYHLFV